MQSLLQSVGGTGGSGDNTNGSNMCNQMSAGGLIEFIPLVNQVVARYKVSVNLLLNQYSK